MNQKKNKTEGQPRQTDQLKRTEIELFEKIKELTSKTEKEAQQIGLEFSEKGFNKKEMCEIARTVSFEHIENERLRRKREDLDPRFYFLLDSVRSIVYTKLDIED